MPPNAVYSFKHALVQDAAHESLLRSARKKLRAEIGKALETHFAEIRDTQPEILAQHYTEAGFVEKAVEYWSRAGQQSSAKSACVETIGHLKKGLLLLASVTESQSEGA